MKKKAKSSLFAGWNCAPNIVTYVRIALSLVFIVLYLVAGDWGSRSIPLRWVALVLFIVAASTDKLDGWMARKYHQVTELGKLLDPIADKILMLAALFIASLFGEVYWWITVLFVLREVSITVMRFYIIKKGGKVIAASAAGKYKTLTQACGIAMIVAPVLSTFGGEGLPSWVISYYAVAFGLLGISLGFAFYSAVLYVYGAFFDKSASEDYGSNIAGVPVTKVNEPAGFAKSPRSPRSSRVSKEAPVAPLSSSAVSDNIDDSDDIFHGSVR